MKMEWMESCGSTNEELKKRLRMLCEQKDAGFPQEEVLLPALAALEQTAGKGRRGRSFASPRGLGLYLSVPIGLSPEGCPCGSSMGPCSTMDDVLRVMPMASVCVCRALEESYPIRCDIKWPNDVLCSPDGSFQGKKLCGILTELFSCGGRSFLILGIGINLNQLTEDFPDELRSKAVSLRQLIGRTTAPQTMAAALLPQIEHMIKALPKGKADAYDYLAFYRSRCVTARGTVDVVFSENAPPRRGQSLGIADDYGLLVRWEDGSQELLKSGEVSIRSAHRKPE